MNWAFPPSVSIWEMEGTVHKKRERGKLNASTLAWCVVLCVNINFRRLPKVLFLGWVGRTGKWRNRPPLSISIPPQKKRGRANTAQCFFQGLTGNDLEKGCADAALLHFTYMQSHELTFFFRESSCHAAGLFVVPPLLFALEDFCRQKGGREGRRRKRDRLKGINWAKEREGREGTFIRCPGEIGRQKRGEDGYNIAKEEDGKFTSSDRQGEGFTKQVVHEMMPNECLKNTLEWLEWIKLFSYMATFTADQKGHWGVIARIPPSDSPP